MRHHQHEEPTIGRREIAISRRRACLGLLAAPALWSRSASAQGAVLRVGHFPNITHVQGLVAHGMSRRGHGWFEPRLGGLTIEWLVYNAGPSAMEALFANSIDLTYVGPSPAINAYAKARGEDIRILAGAAEGGAALIVQPGSNLRSPVDFRGKRLATPQLGNTQDVSARAWLTAGGLRVTVTGGDAQVIPTANPDQLSLFKTRQLDGVWTVEPWVSRLETEAGGVVLVEESDAITTVVVSSARFLHERRDLARRFVAAHRELTEWIKANSAEAQRIAHEELQAETHTDMSPDLLTRALRRTILTATVSRAALESFVTKAQAAGFLRGSPDLARLVEQP
jgi:NitT/TauT family transport system substrate-binding protein